jgi:hypothetical protein
VKAGTVSCALAWMLFHLFSSCAPVGKPALPDRPAGTSAQAAPTRQWTKVSDHPPTWYPRGIPADSPTDHTSGDWIYTEDADGICFFIPRRGLEEEHRKILLAEALAARNPDKVKRIAHEEANHLIGTVTVGGLGRAVWLLGAAGAR